MGDGAALGSEPSRSCERPADATVTATRSDGGVDASASAVAHGPSDRGVHAAALASLPFGGSKRLHLLLGADEPAAAWERVKRGAVPSDVVDSKLRFLWRSYANDLSLQDLAACLESLNAWVTTPLSDHHPARLRDDIDPAPVIFRRGRPVSETRPTVTIIGTRRCTPTGRSLAMELGTGLAEAGLAVVSGLALGIDGAAHRGALAAADADVVAVVGSGIDVVYPRGNSDLWQSVAGRGTLLSEAPLGAAPEPWRFPARNRLLAALSDVVVVVESKIAGGSMHTVEQALRRDVTVMAVPGSVRNPAAAGTNALLSEGCPPVCCVDDVLVAVELATASRTPRSGVAEPTRRLQVTVDVQSSRARASAGSNGPAAASSAADSGARPVSLAGAEITPGSSAGDLSNVRSQRLDPLEQRVLDALDDSPVSLDRLVSRAGGAAPQVLVAVARLEGLGLLVRAGGLAMRA